eukprot:1139019-Pelagomonas_calceolata.AAC.8
MGEPSRGMRGAQGVVRICKGMTLFTNEGRCMKSVSQVVPHSCNPDMHLSLLARSHAYGDAPCCQAACNSACTRLHSWTCMIATVHLGKNNHSQHCNAW